MSRQICRACELLRDDASHLENLVRVAPFVIVPRANLDERRVELNTSLDVEDRGLRAVAEVGRNDRFVRVTEDAREAAFAHALFAGFLHRRADFLIRRRLLELRRQIDERNVRGRNAHGHTRELAVERRENLADGLRRARGGRDHVLEDAAAAAPVLLGRAVDRLLRRRGGVDRRHQAALDAEVVVEDLRDRREAVRRAGGVGDDVLAGVGRVVDAVDEHRGRVLRRSRHDDLLGARGDVLASLLVREEEARGLDDDLGADFVPLELRRILLSREADLLAINDHGRTFDLDVVLERSVNGIELQHVREIIWIEKIVDANDFDVRREVFNRRAENHPPNTAETINTNLDCHFIDSFCCKLFYELDFRNLASLDATRTDRHTLDIALAIRRAHALEVRQKAALRNPRRVETNAAFILRRTLADDHVADRRTLTTYITNSGHFLVPFV